MFKCELCNRFVNEITEHHLVPKEHGGKNHPTTMLCVTCHKQIHALYTNKELFVRLYTLSRLLSEEKIKRYLEFIKKIPGDTQVTIKKSRNVRKRA